MNTSTTPNMPPPNSQTERMATPPRMSTNEKREAEPLRCVKYYDLAVIRADTTQRKLTGYPMTHEECCTMKSKFSEKEQSRIIFVPANV